MATSPSMAPVTPTPTPRVKSCHRLPLRNEAGRFIKSFNSTSTSPGNTPTMKTMPAIKVKGKKFKRTSLDTPRIGKKTSVVWHFFKSLPHDNGISRAVCLLCKVIFKNPGGSTTGMRGHLERKHPGAIERVLTDSYQNSRHRASLPVTSTTTAKTEFKTDHDHHDEDQGHGRSSEGGTPPPPHLSIEYTNSSVVGQTEIFEQDGEILEEVELEDTAIAIASTSRRTKPHILPGPPPKVYSDSEADEITRSIVLYLATSMKPISTLEDHHFRKMLYTMNNAFMVEAGSLENDSILKPVVKAMDTLYKEAKDLIIAKLCNKYLSLSLEIWVKSNSQIYLLITANLISQSWTSLESFFLGLRHLPQICLITHPDILIEKVSSILPPILEEFEIKQENIVHVLLHSVPFNPSGATTQILGKPTWPCFNDTVQRSFDLINEFVTQLTNCDMLHDTLKIGKQVLPQYKQVRKHPGKLMSAMKTFLESQQSTDGLPLKIEEIEECTRLHEPFNVIIDALVDDPLIPASTLLPLVFLVKSVYENQSQVGSPPSTSTWTVEQRQEIVQSVNSQIEAYYKINLTSGDLGGDPLLAVCSFLDPRYKKLKFLSKEQRDYVHDTVLELLHEQGRKEKVPNSGTGSILSVRSENPEYCEMNGGNGDDGASTDPLNTESPPVDHHNHQCELKKGMGKNSKFFDIIGGIIGRRQVQVPSLEAMEELTNYWDEPVPAMTMDPWTWWRYNKERFPKLSELARRYMVIRGTASLTRLDFTVEGKRFFNMLGGIEEEYVERMQFLRRYYSVSWGEVEEGGSGGMMMVGGNCDEQVDIKRETVESIELVDEAME